MMREIKNEDGMEDEWGRGAHSTLSPPAVVYQLALESTSHQTCIGLGAASHACVDQKSLLFSALGRIDKNKVSFFSDSHSVALNMSTRCLPDGEVDLLNPGGEGGLEDGVLRVLGRPVRLLMLSLKPSSDTLPYHPTPSCGRHVTHRHVVFDESRVW